MITEKQKQIIIKEMSPYEPIQIGVFGSVARGDHTEESDIDILYQFNNSSDLLELIRLKKNIKKRLGKKVDFMCFDFINPYIKKRVLSEVKLFFNDKTQKKERPLPCIEHD
ncbi:MAG: nucleotidyltransferase domain-containing protein [Flavobacteriaceae bacterium]|nr:nucleotidyltransferase domain-containing protein [Flavobacteriaceae bacterium]